MEELRAWDRHEHGSQALHTSQADRIVHLCSSTETLKRLRNSNCLRAYLCPESHVSKHTQHCSVKTFAGHCPSWTRHCLREMPQARGTRKTAQKQSTRKCRKCQ